MGRKAYKYKRAKLVQTERWERYVLFGHWKISAPHTFDKSLYKPDTGLLKPEIKSSLSALETVDVGTTAEWLLIDIMFAWFCLQLLSVAKINKETLNFTNDINVLSNILR